MEFCSVTGSPSADVDTRPIHSMWAEGEWKSTPAALPEMLVESSPITLMPGEGWGGPYRLE